MIAVLIICQMYNTYFTGAIGTLKEIEASLCHDTSSQLKPVGLTSSGDYQGTGILHHTNLIVPNGVNAS